MESIYNLQKRAGTLRRQTNTDSITPEDVGGLQYDTLAYIASMEQNAGSLGIRKVYKSRAEMEADTAPVGTNGKELRYGQLVCIYDNSNPTAPDSGDIHAFQNPGWLLCGNISNISALQDDMDNLRTWIEDNREDIEGLGKGIAGLGADRSLPYRFLPGWDTETPGNFSGWELVSASLDKLNGGADDANRSGWYRGLLNGAPFDVRVFERGYANNDWTQVIAGPVSIAGGCLTSGSEFAILRRNCSKGVWEPWKDVIADLKAELNENGRELHSIKASLARFPETEEILTRTYDRQDSSGSLKFSNLLLATRYVMELVGGTELRLGNRKGEDNVILKHDVDIINRPLKVLPDKGCPGQFALTVGDRQVKLRLADVLSLALDLERLRANIVAPEIRWVEKERQPDGTFTDKEHLLSKELLTPERQQQLVTLNKSTIHALQGATARFAGIKEPPEDYEYETETADLSPERIFYVPSHRCFRGLYGSLVFTHWTTEELYNEYTDNGICMLLKDKVYLHDRHLYVWNEEEQTLTPITNGSGGELADGSVTTRKLADGAVTLTKIAPCAFATASEVLEVINK